MNIRRRFLSSAALRVFAASIATLLIASDLMAQAVTCSERAPSGVIGIAALECVGQSCRVSDRDARGGYYHTFSVEPRIGALDNRIVSAKELRIGDVIVAVDGFPITTRKAGYALASLVVGRTTHLRLRRDGKDVSVDIVPVLGCNLPNLSVTMKE